MTIKTAPILVTAAIAATVAATAVAISPPVQAKPQVPSAPACLAWTHTGGLNINQDNGLLVEIDNWLGDSAGTGENNAKLFHANGAPVTQPGPGWDFGSSQIGQARGGNTGNKFDLTIDWGGGLSNHYTGTIDDMGAVKGSTVNSKGVTNGFGVQEHFTCAKQDAPAAAPAPAPDTNRPVHCTAGYTLPPGSDCSKTPNPNPPAAPPPPHDAIAVSYGSYSLITNDLPVTVTNSSAVEGACSYDSTPLGYHHSFTVAPHGSTTWNIKGPPTGTTYNVKVSCTQTGQNNSIGFVNTTKQF